MNLQKTILKECSFEGIDIFTGKLTKMTLYPLQANEGYKITQRNSIIDLSINNVFQTKKNIRTRWSSTTEVKYEGVRLLKPEHTITALYWGLGIDNLGISIEGNSFPRFNGGISKLILELIRNIKKLPSKRVYTEPTQEIQIYGEGDFDKVELLKIKETQKITYKVFFQYNSIRKQEHTTEITSKKFIEELMFAKGPIFIPFGNEKLVRFLFSLIGLNHKQVTEDNSLLIGTRSQEDFKNKTSPYENNQEFVRHKIIDALFPSALRGLTEKARPTNFHAIHYRTGHWSDLESWKSFNLKQINSVKQS